MKQIRVKIKASIAETSGGFLDLAASQPIFPPKREDGTPDVGHVFCVFETDFIRSKLRSGELIIVDDELNEDGSENSESDEDDELKDLSGLNAPESGSAENTSVENITSDPEPTLNSSEPDQTSDAELSNVDNASVNEKEAETSDESDETSADSENSDAE